ncbi:efflux RND transporter periplasmic adaptor subunit [Lyngbya aestuarii]|uniref:efflux RND transporter periplasmic adaptor subunit n=1 Tax=Lyngbya aestuarii TaxID=118322 RepID=UPI00403DADB6
MLTKVWQDNPLQAGKGKLGKPQPKISLLLLLCVLVTGPYVAGCGLLPKTEAGAQSQPPRGEASSSPSVDVAIAKTGVLQEPLDYTGTTRPVREVSLRSRTEGRLLSLGVDTGDSVKRGQILARLDDNLLLTAVSEAKAELAALQSEVSRAQTQVSNARAQAEQARLELEQAKVDAARQQSLAIKGAIAKQQAELGQTAAATAQQNLLAVTEQIATEQQAVAAARERVTAQQAVVAQNQERQSYALLASPITGVVLERVTEPGNLITAGSEVLRLGDFSRVKVVVPVSELELANIRVGQSVTVSLDAFAGESFSGEVSRISPAADSAARQVPIEVTIPNNGGRIGSGLLARVNFASDTASQVVIPRTALQVAGKPGNNRARNQEESSQTTEATVFVVTGEGTKATVQARQVQLGDQANNQVEIISGLQPGERFVARSSKSLKDGEAVVLSVLSEQ